MGKEVGWNAGGCLVPVTQHRDQGQTHLNADKETLLLGKIGQCSKRMTNALGEKEAQHVKVPDLLQEEGKSRDIKKVKEKTRESG